MQDREDLRMNMHIFRVFPGGISFATSDLTDFGDTNDAFTKAHMHAAAEAARTKTPHYILRDDSGSRRFGFGGWGATALLDVMNKGFASYWCFATDAWVPLEEEPVQVERRVAENV